MTDLMKGLRDKIVRRDKQRRTKIQVVQPLSMRLLVIVAMLAMLVQTGVMLFVVLREQRSVTITVVNK